MKQNNTYLLGGEVDAVEAVVYVEKKPRRVPLKKKKSKNKLKEVVKK
jgi:hypothetical protein